MEIFENQMNDPSYKGSASLKKINKKTKNKTSPHFQHKIKQHMQILLQSLKKQIIFF